MENKKVGWLIIGAGILMAAIVAIFNSGLRKIIAETCAHGPSCSMYSTVSIQTWISLVVILILIVVGLVIMFSKPQERVIVRTVKENKKRIDMSKLDRDEKKAVTLLQKENGGMFQADLMEKLEIGKVKMTRLLDKLEAKQIIERKRRGMNNIVVLKD